MALFVFIISNITGRKIPENNDRAADGCRGSLLQPLLNLVCTCQSKVEPETPNFGFITPFLMVFSPVLV